jgi:hypothetical protein
VLQNRGDRGWIVQLSVFIQRIPVFSEAQTYGRAGRNEVAIGGHGERGEKNVANNPLSIMEEHDHEGMTRSNDLSDR